jgi:hypothetical protein
MKPHSLEQLVAMLHPYVYHVAMGRAVRRKAKFGTTHWLTLDGRILAPYQMTNEHMINILRMIANSKAVRMSLMDSALGALAYACSADTPDGASMAASSEADALFEARYQLRVETAAELSPLAAAIVELLQNRKINPYHDHGPQPLTDYSLGRRKPAHREFRPRRVVVPHAIEDTARSELDDEIVTEGRPVTGGLVP